MSNFAKYAIHNKSYSVKFERTSKQNDGFNTINIEGYKKQSGNNECLANVQLTPSELYRLLALFNGICSGFSLHRAHKNTTVKCKKQAATQAGKPSTLYLEINAGGKDRHISLVIDAYEAIVIASLILDTLTSNTPNIPAEVAINMLQRQYDAFKPSELQLEQ